MKVAFIISLSVTIALFFYFWSYGQGVLSAVDALDYEKKSDTRIGRVSLWLFWAGFISCIPTIVLAFYMGSQ
jgi:hypothetical protein